MPWVTKMTANNRKVTHCNTTEALEKNRKCLKKLLAKLLVWLQKKNMFHFSSREVAVEENKGRQGVKTVHLSDRPRNKVNPSVDAPAWAGMHSFSLRKISYDGLQVAGAMAPWLKAYFALVEDRSSVLSIHVGLVSDT